MGCLCQTLSKKHLPEIKEMKAEKGTLTKHQRVLNSTMNSKSLLFSQRSHLNYYLLVSNSFSYGKALAFL